MSDLIRREDAIGACAYETFECYEARKAIRNLPSADRPKSVDLTNVYQTAYDNGYARGKADRPRGEWIEVSAFDAFGGDESTWLAHGNPIAFHYCSECKEQTRLDEFGEEMLSKYCPNCGCRMKGADDES